MGKKSQPAPPPPVDPTNAIRAQADVNRINQYTPYGNLTYSGANRNNATLTLDPAIQALFDQQIQNDTGLGQLAGGALGSIGQLVAAPPNLSGLPNPQLPQLANVNLQTGVDLGRLNTEGLPGFDTDASGTRNRAERAFFDRSANLLNEQFGRQEESLQQRLANQGLQEDNVAARTQMGDFGRGRNEAFQNLANEAVIFGGNEASRDLQNQLALRGQGFDEALTGGTFNNQAALSQAGFGNEALFNQNQLNNTLAQQNFGNQASLRNQSLSEQQALRGTQFNELAALLGLNQVQPTQLQNFFGPGQVDALGAFALNQQGLQNNFNTQSQAASQAKGATASLLGNLGGAAIGASDPRLKENVEEVGTFKGYNWYIWDWNTEAEALGLTGKGMGVMADEVDEKVMVDGYWHVDYGRL